MLGVWGDKVVIVTPGCQDIVTLIDKDGKVEGGFNRFTMAAINPHTTQAKGDPARTAILHPRPWGLVRAL
ncbi:hypothetical protein VT98_11645 [Candidatus Electrothrix communis]|uniref:Uncharacterized protein n=1 Tax=Candidatus Electrothrix communis TaxID=1859133 RepID=A0A444J5J7_9BACT|nr:hypothetical protein VT98_11645 [Candidatus Electrothrix communis]